MSDLKNMNNDYMIRRSQVVKPGTEVSKPQSNVTGPSFNDVLNKIQSGEGVKFSKHAIDRLNSRNIALSEEELGRISNGMDKAKSKGVRDALIMMDNKVFVASVSNKTIITAAMDEQLKENVFTNIDGAVIV
ncbi:MAG: flagellar protein [Firmicutes bacterium]|nr:flagellar protein [Bacillota bacterium]